jgi:hypothetical protein
MTMDITPAPITPRRERPRKKEKETAFEILNLHAKREFREVSIDRLIIPIEDYQRDEAEGRIAADIAMHFDCVAFGCLLVIARSNGQLMVADGGTRLSGVRQRKDIKTVPCLVFSGLTDKQEADVFLRINQNRRRLRIDQQHHAELFSDHTLAVQAQMLIDELRCANIGFDSLATMRAAVRSQPGAAAAVVHILTTAARDKHVTARVMKGLVSLEAHLVKEGRTLFIKRTMAKVMTEFGKFDAVLNALVEPRKRGDPKTFARAIARTLHIKSPKGLGK